MRGVLLELGTFGWIDFLADKTGNTHKRGSLVIDMNGNYSGL
jgi:hypothetical protein